jgi:phosphoglycolate phosphatase
VSVRPSSRRSGGLAVAPRAVLFDLDGTLLDTAADIAAALNGALARQRLAPLPVATVRELIGRGVPTLIQRTVTRLGAAGAGVDAARLQSDYHACYAELNDRGAFSARPYPGVGEGLQVLHERGLRLAVVTNKPHASASGVLKSLGLLPWIDLVVGGDTCARRKPDPLPLLTACHTLKVQAVEALMVGDSAVDVEAARAAGIPVVCVPYGYNEGNDPRSLPCDGFLESIGELPALLAG